MDIISQLTVGKLYRICRKANISHGEAIYRQKGALGTSLSTAVIQFWWGMVEKGVFFWYNDCDLKRKQVKILYEPVAVKHGFWVVSIRCRKRRHAIEGNFEKVKQLYA